VADFDLCSLDAASLVRLIGRRDVSREQVMRAHIERIGRLDGMVHAFVELRPEAALAQARAADADHVVRAGLPLDGIPVSIKDHFDVAGWRRTEGVCEFAARLSPADAEVVKRLRNAGAIVIGKANQPDFQIRWNTVSSLHGATRNPRDPLRTAGGSSGGDAAAVAAGFAPLGLGADYGGSIRVPASFCGVWGLRPSAGRVPGVATLPPLDGPPTLDLMNSIGPFARSLSDLETAYHVLAGMHAGDPATVPVAVGGRPLASAATEISGSAIAGSTIDPEGRARRGGRPRVARMVTQTGARVDPEIVARVDAVATALADAGYEVVDAGIPCAARAPEVWAELVGTELMRVAMPAWRAMIGESNRQHIEAMFGLYELGSDVVRYVDAFAERRMIARETALWMESHPLVLAPVAGMAAPLLDFDHFLDEATTRTLFDTMRNVMWVNALSLPSIALPNGVQLVGRRFREDEIFAAAAVAERALEPVTIATPLALTAPSSR
jgi:amidase